VQYGVYVAYARGLEAIVELGRVEGLYVGSAELGELHRAKGGNDVLPDLQLVVVVCARCEVRFGDIF
jgi:hypothetical protein